VPPAINHFTRWAMNPSNSKGFRTASASGKGVHPRQPRRTPRLRVLTGRVCMTRQDARSARGETGRVRRQRGSRHLRGLLIQRSAELRSAMRPRRPRSVASNHNRLQTEAPAGRPGVAAILPRQVVRRQVAFRQRKRTAQAPFLPAVHPARARVLLMLSPPRAATPGVPAARLSSPKSGAFAQQLPFGCVSRGRASSVF
jgi:hypothetical protein